MYGLASMEMAQVMKYVCCQLQPKKTKVLVINVAAQGFIHCILLARLRFNFKGGLSYGRQSVFKKGRLVCSVVVAIAA